MVHGLWDAEELSSDEQSTYTSQETKDFLKAWGERHRLSSTYFPHARGVESHCRGQGEGSCQETCHMPGKVEQTCQGAEGIGGGTVGQGPEPGRKSRQEVDKDRYGGGSRSWSQTVCCENGRFKKCQSQFLKTFNGVANMMADETHANEPQANEPVRHEGVEGGQDHDVRDVQGVMGGDDAGTVVEVKDRGLATQQAQEVDGATAGERTRYPRRERRIPARYKDFEMGEVE